MVATANGKSAATAQASRMNIGSITTGKQRKPLRILVYGVDGVGKTTFAANAPNAIIVPTEEGANELEVAKFPLARSVEDVREAIRVLTYDKHDYKTVVVDSLDWAESLVFQHVIDGSAPDKSGAKPTIEDAAGGYGRGYSAAVDVYRALISDLEQLQGKREMHVILIAHTLIKNYKNPSGDDYERFYVKMNDKSAALWREWCSGVYFANFEILTKTDKRKRVRGVTTGARYLHTVREGAFDAKDRYGLPEQVPLSWGDFWAAYEAGQPADPDKLIAEIQRKATALGGDIEKATPGLLEKCGRNATLLSQLNTRLNAKLGEKSEAETVTPAAQ